MYPYYTISHFVLRHINTHALKLRFCTHIHTDSTVVWCIQRSVSSAVRTVSNTSLQAPSSWSTRSSPAPPGPPHTSACLNRVSQPAMEKTQSSIHSYCTQRTPPRSARSVNRCFLMLKGKSIHTYTHKPSRSEKRSEKRQY